MKLNNKYDVIFAEMNDGTFESTEMTLKDIIEYKGKEVYVFSDSMGYPMISYNHDGKNIDWNFMREISDKFGD